MTQEMAINHVELHDDGKALQLTVQLHNPTARTLHAYTTIRALRYDAATQVLEVQLSDRGLRELIATDIFVRPRFTSVDPNGDSAIKLAVPRVICRLAAGVNQRSAKVERLLAHEARHIDIEIAWSGTPFYPDPRGKTKGPRADLVAWAQGFARHRHTRAPEPEKQR